MFFRCFGCLPPAKGRGKAKKYHERLRCSQKAHAGSHSGQNLGTGCLAKSSSKKRGRIDDLCAQAKVHGLCVFFTSSGSSSKTTGSLRVRVRWDKHTLFRMRFKATTRRRRAFFRRQRGHDRSEPQPIATGFDDLPRTVQTRLPRQPTRPFWTGLSRFPYHSVTDLQVNSPLIAIGEPS